MNSSNKAVHVAVAVIEKNHKILIAKRHDHVHMGGLWEFPGGKVEKKEDIEQALNREIIEELGIIITKSQPLIQIPHTYPEKTVFLDVFRVLEFEGEAQGLEQQEIRWVNKSDLHHFEFPPANSPIVNATQLPSHYLITPEPQLDQLDIFLRQLELNLQSGVSLVQLRAKTLEFNDLKKVYDETSTLINNYHASLFVNCNIDTAKLLNIKHIHLSSSNLQEMNPEKDEFTFAASCHNAEEIQRAIILGVKFIVLSPVKPTNSHPQNSPLGWANFQSLCQQCTVPVYALGGMQLSDIPPAIHHGAQGIAGISAFWNTNEY